MPFFDNANFIMLPLQLWPMVSNAALRSSGKKRTRPSLLSPQKMSFQLVLCCALLGRQTKIDQKNCVEQGGPSVNLQPHSKARLCRASWTLGHIPCYIWIQCRSFQEWFDDCTFQWIWDCTLEQTEVYNHWGFRIVPSNKLVFTFRKITAMRMSKKTMMISAGTGSMHVEANFNLVMTFFSHWSKVKKFHHWKWWEQKQRTSSLSVLPLTGNLLLQKRLSAGKPPLWPQGQERGKRKNPCPGACQLLSTSIILEVQTKLHPAYTENGLSPLCPSPGCTCCRLACSWTPSPLFLKHLSAWQCAFFTSPWSLIYQAVFQWSWMNFLAYGKMFVQQSKEHLPVECHKLFQIRWRWVLVLANL